MGTCQSWNSLNDVPSKRFEEPDLHQADGIVILSFVSGLQHNIMAVLTLIRIEKLGL